MTIEKHSLVITGIFRLLANLIHLKMNFELQLFCYKAELVNFLYYFFQEQAAHHGDFEFW